MKLHVVLTVKFRWLFITFANYSQTWDIPIPGQVPVPPGTSLIHFDKQGVKLDVTVITG